jgi:hypothetical protein
MMIDRLKFVLWQTGTSSGFTLQFHLLTDGRRQFPSDAQSKRVSTNALASSAPQIPQTVGPMRQGKCEPYGESPRQGKVA